MKINSVNSNSYSNYNPNFKSTYPVIHWVAETNGSYAPISNLEIIRKLQGKIIRILNKALSQTNKPMNQSEQNLRAYIGSCDIDYRKMPIVRSFDNRVQAEPDKYTPIAYMISGCDVDNFNNLLAKSIGKAKSKAKELLSTPYSHETISAIENYNKFGFTYVNQPSVRIKDKNGVTYTLHTKFEIIRNKSGKIKDYRFQAARFLPDNNTRRLLDRLY